MNYDFVVKSRHWNLATRPAQENISESVSGISQLTDSNCSRPDVKWNITIGRETSRANFNRNPIQRVKGLELRSRVDEVESCALLIGGDEVSHSRNMPASQEHIAGRLLNPPQSLTFRVQNCGDRATLNEASMQVVDILSWEEIRLPPWRSFYTKLISIRCWCERILRVVIFFGHQIVANRVNVKEARSNNESNIDENSVVEAPRGSRSTSWHRSRPVAASKLIDVAIDVVVTNGSSCLAGNIDGVASNSGRCCEASGTEKFHFLIGVHVNDSVASGRMEPL